MHLLLCHKINKLHRTNFIFLEMDNLTSVLRNEIIQFLQVMLTSPVFHFIDQPFLRKLCLNKQVIPEIALNNSLTMIHRQIEIMQNWIPQFETKLMNDTKTQIEQLQNESKTVIRHRGGKGKYLSFDDVNIHDLIEHVNQLLKMETSFVESKQHVQTSVSSIAEQIMKNIDIMNRSIKKTNITNIEEVKLLKPPFCPEFLKYMFHCISNEQFQVGAKSNQPTYHELKLIFDRYVLTLTKWKHEYGGGNIWSQTKQWNISNGIFAPIQDRIHFFENALWVGRQMYKTLYAL